MNRRQFHTASSALAVGRFRAPAGFESHGSTGTILTGEGVLGVAYDESTAK